MGLVLFWAGTSGPPRKEVVSWPCLSPVTAPLLYHPPLGLLCLCLSFSCPLCMCSGFCDPCQLNQLEERAEQIRSKSYLIQVEREKMQMELSHKRARVELERAANTSARNYEREVDRNQELLARIRQLQEREAEAEEKMQEQLERHKLCKQSLDTASQQLWEKEDGLATASETINVLKGRVSELQWSLMDQEVQVKRLESEKQELKEQLELQLRKCQEVNQKIQELQASQEARTDQEQKIKDLEQKLCLQEQDAAVVRSMKSELLRLPRMERELKRLREDNAHLREMRETNGLLTEELEGLQRRLGRQEKMQETLVDLELEKERLLAKLQSWENLDHTMGLDLRTPEDLSRFVVELQQRELALKEKNSAIASSAQGLEKAQQQLQEEVRQVSSQLLEERKKRETHEALARRLQKRVLLLTKERDGMRAILGSYDSEMTQAEYSPQLTRRVREAEDMVQKVHAHSTEMEAQLTQALEELGGQKQRADMLEMELKMLKSQPGSAESSFPFCREEVDTLRANVSTRVQMLSLNPGAQTGLQKDPTSEGAIYTLNSVMLQSWNHSVEAALGTLNLILPGLVAWHGGSEDGGGLVIQE
ncbi:mitotic spindle assembly checkpoint protein MAD1-like isoform X6 [Ictidomys tridecemlineatus]